MATLSWGPCCWRDQGKHQGRVRRRKYLGTLRKSQMFKYLQQAYSSQSLRIPSSSLYQLSSVDDKMIKLTNALPLLFAALPLCSGYLVEPPTTADPRTVSDCSLWAVVASGDTCSSIARAWGISVADFSAYVCGKPSLPSNLQTNTTDDAEPGS